MVKAKFNNEQELAARVIEYLKEDHWDIYQEVVCPGGVADIVAVRGNLKWVIECKLSVSMTLLGQAIERQPYFHYTSIAIPNTRRDNASYRFIHQFLRWKGIGLFEVNPPCYHEVMNYARLEPKLFRKAKTDVIKLYEEQKDMVGAGACHGGYFTPFKRTCRNVQEVVKKEPGITLKELINKADHHYSSNSTAKQSIRYYIEIGVIDGIEMKKDGKFLRFYPKDEREVKSE